MGDGVITGWDTRGTVRRIFPVQGTSHVSEGGPDLLHANVSLTDAKNRAQPYDYAEDEDDDPPQPPAAPRTPRRGDRVVTPEGARGTVRMHGLLDYVLPGGSSIVRDDGQADERYRNTQLRDDKNRVHYDHAEPDDRPRGQRIDTPEETEASRRELEEADDSPPETPAAPRTPQVGDRVRHPRGIAGEVTEAPGGSSTVRTSDGRNFRLNNTDLHDEKNRHEYDFGEDDPGVGKPISNGAGADKNGHLYGVSGGKRIRLRRGDMPEDFPEQLQQWAESGVPWEGSEGAEREAHDWMLNAALRQRHLRRFADPTHSAIHRGYARGARVAGIDPDELFSEARGHHHANLHSDPSEGLRQAYRSALASIDGRRAGVEEFADSDKPPATLSPAQKQFTKPSVTPQPKTAGQPAYQPRDPEAAHPLSGRSPVGRPLPVDRLPGTRGPVRLIDPDEGDTPKPRLLPPRVPGGPGKTKVVPAPPAPSKAPEEDARPATLTPADISGDDYFDTPPPPAPPRPAKPAAPAGTGRGLDMRNVSDEEAQGLPSALPSPEHNDAFDRSKRNVGQVADAKPAGPPPLPRQEDIPYAQPAGPPPLPVQKKAPPPLPPKPRRPLAGFVPPPGAPPEPSPQAQARDALSAGRYPTATNEGPILRRGAKREPAAQKEPAAPVRDLLGRVGGAVKGAAGAGIDAARGAAARVGGVAQRGAAALADWGRGGQPPSGETPAQATPARRKLPPQKQPLLPPRAENLGPVGRVLDTVGRGAVGAGRAVKRGLGALGPQPQAGAQAAAPQPQAAAPVAPQSQQATPAAQAVPAAPRNPRSRAAAQRDAGNVRQWATSGKLTPQRVPELIRQLSGTDAKGRTATPGYLYQLYRQLGGGKLPSGSLSRAELVNLVGRRLGAVAANPKVLKHVEQFAEDDFMDGEDMHEDFAEGFLTFGEEVGAFSSAPRRRRLPPARKHAEFDDETPLPRGHHRETPAETEARLTAMQDADDSPPPGVTTQRTPQIGDEVRDLNDDQGEVMTNYAGRSDFRVPPGVVATRRNSDLRNVKNGTYYHHAEDEDMAESYRRPRVGQRVYPGSKNTRHPFGVVDETGLDSGLEDDPESSVVRGQGDHRVVPTGDLKDASGQSYGKQAGTPGMRKNSEDDQPLSDEPSHGSAVGTPRVPLDRTPQRGDVVQVPSGAVGRVSSRDPIYDIGRAVIYDAPASDGLPGGFHQDEEISDPKTGAPYKARKHAERRRRLPPPARPV